MAGSPTSRERMKKPVRSLHLLTCEEKVFDVPGSFMPECCPVSRYVIQHPVFFLFNVYFCLRSQPVPVFQPAAGRAGQSLPEWRVEKHQILLFGITGKKTEHILLDHVDLRRGQFITIGFQIATDLSVVVHLKYRLSPSRCRFKSQGAASSK